MRIVIDKSSDLKISIQLSEQIVFQIATGKLKPGDTLPSVRQMVQRYGIHKGAVSEAFKDLVERQWVRRQRGSKMVVRAPLDPLDTSSDRNEGLDNLIDATIAEAIARGYTLEELRQRASQRLSVEAPDHVLVVEEEPALRKLLHRELSQLLKVPVDSISPEELADNQQRLRGALVLGLPGRMWRLVRLIPRTCPHLRLEPSGLDEYTGKVRSLKTPSVIGVASVSSEFLFSARCLLAPFIGSFHSLEEFLLGEKETRNLSGLDLVFCDTIANAQVKARNRVHYRLICDATAREIANRVQRNL